MGTTSSSLGVRAHQEFIAPGEFCFRRRGDATQLGEALKFRWEMVTLATGVLLAALRHPALLAHQLASLDALAAGRLRAGFGLGFNSPESQHQFQIAGVPFATRATRLEESIVLMRELWSLATVPPQTR